MTSDPFETCWAILPRVSRSFALVIRRLPRGLDDSVMISYLLCRIADTIEDSRRPAEERRRMLAAFAGSLRGGTAEVPKDLYPRLYRGLMTHTDDVLACYRTLDPPIRGLLAECVDEMCSGMSKWCDREIRTIQDQNEYCYYVAGVVGRLLTKLFHAHGHVDARCAARLQAHAVDFGLALQKVNVLRDVRADLEDGRCYWPTEILERHGLRRDTLLRPESVPAAMKVMDDLIADQWGYLKSALRYLTLLPMTQFRVRLFCAIPLFMAVATVRKCQSNPEVFLSPQPVKIPSRQVRTIVMRSLGLGFLNGYLQSWFRRWQTGARHAPA